jgi:hypothetical protein
MFKSTTPVQEPGGGDPLLSSGRADGSNRFPFDEVGDDQCLRFTLVILPHIYRFLKFYKSSAPNFSAIADQEVSLFSTLRRTLARRIRSDDYILLVETVFGHMRDFAQHPEDSCRVIGEIAAAMFHYLNINLRRSRAFLVVAAEYIPNDHRLQAGLARLDAQFTNQFRIVSQIAASPQLGNLRAPEGDDDLKYLTRSPVGQRFASLGLSSPWNAPRCTACREGIANTFAFPCGCALVCDICKTDGLATHCPRCGQKLGAIAKIPGLKEEVNQ